MKKLLVIAIALALLTPARAAVTQYNVKSFGARGDGIVNDAPAFQRAVNACLTNYVGSLYAPKGTYRFGSTVIVSNGLALRGLHLYGDGQGSTILVADATTPVLKFEFIRDWSIKDMSIMGPQTDGLGATNTNHGLWVSRATHGLIEQVLFWGLTGHGIWFQPTPGEVLNGQGSSHTIQIRNCKFTNNRGDAIYDEGGACGALDIGPRNEMTSTDNTVARCAIRLNKASGPINIYNNTIETLRDGIIVEGSNLHAPQSVNIVGNYLENFFLDADPVVAGHGIRWGSGGNVFNLRIVGNFYYDDGGVLAYGDGGITFGFQWSMNYISSSSSVGLVQGSTTFKYGYIDPGYEEIADFTMNWLDGASVFDMRGKRPSTYSYTISGDFPILEDRPSIIALDPGSADRNTWIAYTNQVPGETITLIHKGFNGTLTFTNTGTVLYPRQHVTFIGLGAVGGNAWLEAQPPGGKSGGVPIFQNGLEITNRIALLPSSGFFPTNMAGIFSQYDTNNTGFAFSLRSGAPTVDPLFVITDPSSGKTFSVNSRTADVSLDGSLAFAGIAQLIPSGALLKLRDSADTTDGDFSARDITASGSFIAASASFASLTTDTLTTTNLVYGATNAVPANTNAVLWLPVVVGGVTGSVPWMANP